MILNEKNQLGLSIMAQLLISIYQMINSDIERLILLSIGCTFCLLLIFSVFTPKFSQTLQNSIISIINTVSIIALRNCYPMIIFQCIIGQQMLKINRDQKILKGSLILNTFLITTINSYENVEILIIGLLISLIYSICEYNTQNDNRKVEYASQSQLNLVNVDTQVRYNENPFKYHNSILLDENLQLVELDGNLNNKFFSTSFINLTDLITKVNVTSIDKKTQELINFQDPRSLKELLEEALEQQQSITIYETDEQLLNQYFIHITPTKSMVLINFIENRDYHKYFNKKISKQLINKLYDSFSHEFGTLLNQIVLNIQIGIEKFHQFEKYFACILKCCKIMQNQIKDIKDYKELQNKSFHYEINQFTVQELFDEIKDTYQIFFAQKQIEIKFICTIQEEIVQDKQRILQILFNLISNSIKFSRNKGFIKISITKVFDGILKFEVEDNGIGIVESTQQKIQQYLNGDIDSSSRLSKHVAGLGLGILNSNKLIQALSKTQRHKFKLQFSSDQNTTTKFWFKAAQFYIEESRIIPFKQISYVQSGVYFNQRTQYNIHSNNIIKNITDPKQQQQKNQKYKKCSIKGTLSAFDDFSVEQDIPSLQISNWEYEFLPKFFNNGSTCQCTKILLVDDEMFNLIPLRIIIHMLGKSSDIANSGIEAIQMVQTRQEQKSTKKKCCRYNLVLLDINMPQMNGFECAKQLISLQNTINIVACTAFTDSETKYQAETVGMINFLEKPIIKEKLINILNQYS